MMVKMLMLAAIVHIRLFCKNSFVGVFMEI